MITKLEVRNYVVDSSSLLKLFFKIRSNTFKLHCLTSKTKKLLLI